MNHIIAVLAYNSQNLVNQLLLQIPEFILIDNGSSVKLEHSNTMYIPENKFFTGGWNYAMERLCEYDWVWMLNSDLTNILPNHMSDLVTAAETLSKSNIKVAAVTPAFNSPHPVFHQKNSKSLREVTWVDWCCPLVSTEAWKNVGPFDDSFKGYGADLDWCKRARLQGYKFYVNDAVCVNHLGSVTTINEGVSEIMSNVQNMNRILKSKWNVDDWSALT